MSGIGEDKMTFGNWEEEIHNSELQKKRMISAASSSLTPLSVDYQEKTATFSGRHGVYQTTLNTCSCGDFLKRHLPCKHIYRLGYEIEHIDLGRVVIHNSDAIVSPEVEDKVDNAIRICTVIDGLPESSYTPMLTVLRTIKELGRPISTIDSAIEYLLDKIQKGSSISLVGKIFVLTGELSSMSRTEFGSALESKGARISGSISKKTDFLVAGVNGTEGKLQRAQEMGIPILTENEFLNLL